MTDNETIIRISIPFKDQRATNAVKKQLCSLGNKIGLNIQPVFTSKKLEQVLKPNERKSSIVSQRNVVYYYKCDLSEADYVGFTTRHLHQRMAEHKAPTSSIGRHAQKHGTVKESQFKVLKKCKGKFDCFVNEMLFIKHRKPSLNKQSDSIRAKRFI